MKKTNLFLFIIGISFFSCTGAEKKPIGTISDIATDFPTTEKLEFKPFNKYNILENGNYMIDGSILWQFTGNDPNNVGYCYDLNTGEKLSTIASIGNAGNEFIGVSFSNSVMTRDSIHLYAASSYGINVMTSNGGSWTIKTFAKKDITENLPLGERKFSVITSPDSIFATKMVKLPNGSGLVNIIGIRSGDTPPETSINNNTIAIFNNKDVKGYQTINYDSFGITDFEPNSAIKFTYSLGKIEVKDNNIAAFSMNSNFILQTVNLNNGKVLNEKRYVKIQMKEKSSTPKNEMRIYIDAMRSNDKYIYCVVSGYFTEEDKELKQQQRELFVFDWDLNPIKRFELPNEREDKLIISYDCSTIYIGKQTEEGLVLTKADLNI